MVIVTNCLDLDKKYRLNKTQSVRASFTKRSYDKNLHGRNVAKMGASSMEAPAYASCEKG